MVDMTNLSPVGTQVCALTSKLKQSIQASVPDLS